MRIFEGDGRVPLRWNGHRLLECAQCMMPNGHLMLAWGKVRDPERACLVRHTEEWMSECEHMRLHKFVRVAFDRIDPRLFEGLSDWSA